MSEFEYFYKDDYFDCELPVKGSTISAFLNIGFEFGPFENGDRFRKAKLPNGWVKRKFKEDFYHILDENNSVRALVFESEKKPFMYPDRRFSVGKVLDDLSITFIVYDNDIPVGEKQIEIFSKRLVLPDYKRYKSIYDSKVKELEINNPASKWLDENYPKWNDYEMYWGKDIKE